MESPFIIVIFGGTGDLAQHKLFPSFFSLFEKNMLPETFFIIGFSRRDFSDDAYREMIEKKLSGNQEKIKEFLKHVEYQQGLFHTVDGYTKLIQRLNGYDAQVGACIMRIFYLAAPPDNYESILEYLHKTKLSEGCGQGSDTWTRVVIEKPFGKDLETAKTLDKKLDNVFGEKQIFRVDHYLGKETVQNMLAFRFANGIFEPVWNREYIDHVQITWAEEKGLATRGKFFDGVGMLRDVGQNHLMQLIASVVMEQPKGFSREAIRDARATAIKSLRLYAEKNPVDSIVRGQYEGYLQEKDILSTSKTETYAAVKLCVENDRFKHVPFYIRAGKHMARNTVEISIVFRQTCHILFKEYGCPEIGNVLTFRIQPNEGIGLRVIAKQPGGVLSLNTVDMSFSYHHSFGKIGLDAYEKILLDIFSGDQMLFNRSDELESSWELITQILDYWSQPNIPIFTYSAGTWGPNEGFELIELDGRKWIEW